MKHKFVCICGPTASGKTEFAHKLAKKIGGEIVNADSMQLYKGLETITASPMQKLQQEVPYWLYNFLPASTHFTVIDYCHAASKASFDIIKANKIPILVGGSGMYISALINGYNEIPDVPQNIRDEVISVHNKYGNDGIYKKLLSANELFIGYVNPNDTQRLMRAYEILLHTGEPFFTFYNRTRKFPLGDLEPKIIYLNPERAFLYKMCNQRVVHLFNDQSIEEIKQLQNPHISVQKAIGVLEIMSYLRDDFTQEEAMESIRIRTRQYAKRQQTWFNNQIIKHKMFEFRTKEDYKDLIQSIPKILGPNSQFWQ